MISSDDIVALALGWVEALDRAREATENWRNAGTLGAKWEALRFAERLLEREARALRGTVRSMVLSDGDVRLENERLRAELHKLRREVNEMRIAAERRNKDLDALHLVWCDGGCEKGVHRYCDNPDGVTEELVALAERHVARLRSWYRNRQGKLRNRQVGP